MSEVFMCTGGLDVDQCLLVEIANGKEDNVYARKSKSKKVLVFIFYENEGRWELQSRLFKRLDEILLNYYIRKTKKEMIGKKWFCF